MYVLDGDMRYLPKPANLNFLCPNAGIQSTAREVFAQDGAVIMVYDCGESFVYNQTSNDNSNRETN